MKNKNERQSYDYLPLSTPYDSILELFLPKPKGYIRFEAITL